MKLKNLYPEEMQILGIRNGENHIMEFVYRTYFPMVRNFILNNKGQESDAEDIYQEGLLAVFKKIREGENIQYLKSYIYSVCRLKWLNELRNKRRHPMDIVDNTGIQFVETALPEEEDIPYLTSMMEALNALDEICRKLLIAFYYEKLSLETIAERFQYSQANTAKSKKNKCMDRIRTKAKMILESKEYEK